MQKYKRRTNPEYKCVNHTLDRELSTRELNCTTCWHRNRCTMSNRYVYRIAKKRSKYER